MTQATDFDAAIGMPHDPALYRALVAGLYSDALLLADEARAWFDGAGPAGAWQAGAGQAGAGQSGVGQAGAGQEAWPSPLAQVTLGCESLRVTLRITHALSWLMTERARLAGDRPDQRPAQIAASVPPPDAATLGLLPPAAVRLIRASERLLVRISRLAVQDRVPPSAAPVHQLLDRLRAHY